jgi:uncharacterized protein (DUF1684 family)
MQRLRGGAGVVLLVSVWLAQPAGADCPECPAFHSDLAAWRDNVDFRFRDRILSPLTEADRLEFRGLSYFEGRPEFAVRATMTPARDTSIFAMPTFGRGTLEYSRVGSITARLDGHEIRLAAFRRESDDALRTVLLIPFRDATNGSETYGGGRYLELKEPLSEPLIIDFNRAMNPLCAYDDSYACPVPPAENHLPFPVRAGEKRYH